MCDTVAAVRSMRRWRLVGLSLMAASAMTTLAVLGLVLSG